MSKNDEFLRIFSNDGEPENIIASIGGNQVSAVSTIDFSDINGDNPDVSCAVTIKVFMPDIDIVAYGHCRGFSDHFILRERLLAFGYDVFVIWNDEPPKLRIVKPPIGHKPPTVLLDGEVVPFVYGLEIYKITAHKIVECKFAIDTYKLLPFLMEQQQVITGEKVKRANEILEPIGFAIKEVGNVEK